MMHIIFFFSKLLTTKKNTIYFRVQCCCFLFNQLVFQLANLWTTVAYAGNEVTAGERLLLVQRRSPNQEILVITGTVIAIGRQTDDTFFCCRPWRSCAIGPVVHQKWPTGKSICASPVSFSSHAVHRPWSVCVTLHCVYFCLRRQDCARQHKCRQKSCDASKGHCSILTQSAPVCRHSFHLPPVRVVCTCLDLGHFFWLARGIFCLLVRISFFFLNGHLPCRDIRTVSWPPQSPSGLLLPTELVSHQGQQVVQWNLQQCQPGGAGVFLPY